MASVHAQPCPRRNWYWIKRARCGRCQSLRSNHGLTLAELIDMRETQDRRCYYCQKELADPRASRHGSSEIDHDHKVCPKRNHSCERCRRGLACHDCNVQELSQRSAGLWVLPEKSDELVRWLEFLGPEGRDRLRAGLIQFPEQPARKASRRRSRAEEPMGALFDLDDYRSPA
jgi:Recombination endonuclease VII